MVLRTDSSQIKNFPVTHPDQVFLHHKEGGSYRQKKSYLQNDQNMVARMFDNLKAKIHSANENGLSSL